MRISNFLYGTNLTNLWPWNGALWYPHYYWCLILFEISIIHRGCTESNCTGVIFICFHQFILPIMLHMTKYDLETLIEYIFSYFLVRLLNPCWSAFLILAFKWSNILMIGFTSNSFAHFWIFLKIRPQKWSDTLFSCKIWCSFRILGWFEPTSTVKGFKLGKTTFFTVFNFFLQNLENGNLTENMFQSISLELEGLQISTISHFNANLIRKDSFACH